MRMDQVWIYKRYYLLHHNDFSVAQLLRAQLLLGSAALVLGSVLISGSFCFDGFGLAGKVRTFGFGSQVAVVNNVVVA